MVMRFSADQPGKQNLIFSYAPNPMSTGQIAIDGSNGLVYSAFLENNGMKYAVRIQATVKGGTLNNSDGKLTIKDADEAVFYVTADTDYKMNFAPDFTDPKTYVGVNPLETTQQWMEDAVAKGYTNLLDEHYKDYAALFNRVKLELNPTVKTANLPTEQRLKTIGKDSRTTTWKTLLSVRTLSADSQFTTGQYARQPARYLA